MKKLLLIAFFAGAFVLTSGPVDAQILLPTASPRGVVTQDVGLTHVKVDYSRPKRKGRMIFGQGSQFLVPFGQMWRTGANSGTVVSFSDAVTMKGSQLPAGDYLLLTIPNREAWDIIFYSDISLGGNVGSFDESKEALRINVTPGVLSEPVETFTINIADLSEDNKRAVLELAWENTVVRVGFEVDFDSKVMAMIEENTQVDPGNLMAAASYYLQTNRNLEQALVWADQYLVNHPDEFWNIHVKAQILAGLGRNADAIETARLSLEKARANGGDDFGYVKRNQDFIANLESK